MQPLRSHMIFLIILFCDFMINKNHVRFIMIWIYCLRNNIYGKMLSYFFATIDPVNLTIKFRGMNRIKNT